MTAGFRGGKADVFRLINELKGFTPYRRETLGGEEAETHSD